MSLLNAISLLFLSLIPPLFTLLLLPFIVCTLHWWNCQWVRWEHVPTLVGNVADMSPRVVATPTMSAENGRRHNVADAVTGFVAG